MMMDSLLDAAPCGYLIFRDDGFIEQANSTLLRWLNLKMEDVVGKNVESILTLPTRIFYNTHLFPLLKLHGKAEEIFIQFKTNGADAMPALVNAERRVHGNYHLNHCVILPVYHRKKFEEEILNAKRAAEKALEENRHLQELKDSLEKTTLELETHLQKQLSTHQSYLQFSKVISHDLQEPIHKIQVFSDRILKTEKLSEKGRSDATKIDVAATRLRMLTRGLEHFISVDGEQDFGEINLNIPLKSSLEHIAESYPDIDYDLEVDELPAITGSEKQFTLLFFHLLDNAFQFRNPQRKLKIKISALSLDENLYQLSPNRYKYTEHIRLSFSDNGLGFDMQYKDYVFEILKKISPDSNRLGIGLGLIKKIVDNHSGIIKVASGQNEGTTFTITLPRKSR